MKELFPVYFLQGKVEMGGRKKNTSTSAWYFHTLIVSDQELKLEYPKDNQAPHTV